MNAGAVAYAAAIQVQHLAGKTVLDTVDAVAGGHKIPLLPFSVDIVPQLNLGAVIDVIISNLHNLAVGSADGIELTVGKYGLGNFLFGCHIGIPPNTLSGHILFPSSRILFHRNCAWLRSLL